MTKLFLEIHEKFEAFIISLLLMLLMVVLIATGEFVFLVAMIAVGRQSTMQRRRWLHSSGRPLLSWRSLWGITY